MVEQRTFDRRLRRRADRRRGGQTARVRLVHRLAASLGTSARSALAPDLDEPGSVLTGNETDPRSQKLMNDFDLSPQVRRWRQRFECPASGDGHEQDQLVCQVAPNWNLRPQVLPNLVAQTLGNSLRGNTLLSKAREYFRKRL